MIRVGNGSKKAVYLIDENSQDVAAIVNQDGVYMFEMSFVDGLKADDLRQIADIIDELNGVK